MSYIFHILVLNGPNLNLLGIRDPEKYGTTTLDEIINRLNIEAEKLNIKLYHMQSNAEHKLINRIHQAKHQDRIDFIIINPSAFTHTSIAIRDALLAVNIPFIEIHLTNIYKREKFRQNSYFSDIAIGVISGIGVNGYLYALQASVMILTQSLNN